MNVFWLTLIVCWGVVGFVLTVDDFYSNSHNDYCQVFMPFSAAKQYIRAGIGAMLPRYALAATRLKLPTNLKLGV